MPSQPDPYEAHARKILEPLRLWRARHFGFLTPQESNDLIRLMEGVIRRAKVQDRKLGEDTNA